MQNWLKAFVKYTVSFALGAGLLWYVYRDTNITSLYHDIKQAELSWVLLSFFFTLISHVARAYRWNLLMEPVNISPGIRNSFFAVMVGYLANILLPRMGEVSRCAILHKTNDVPVNKSFGTVITERVFDLLSLIFILSVALLIEMDRLSDFVLGMLGSKVNGGSGIYLVIATGMVVLILGAGLAGLLIRLAIKKYAHTALFQKVYVFVSGLLQGVLSFRKLKKKKEFIVSTIVIWVCYFYMSYVIFFALPDTGHLGISAGLAVLVLGGIGMAAPSPGGIGSYHWIIMNGLLLYGLSLEQGRLYATLVHSSQLLFIVSVGLLSLFATLIIGKKKRQKINVVVE